MGSTNFELYNEAALGAEVPHLGWNDMANVLDNQGGFLGAICLKEGALSGWTIANGTTINVAAGEGVVGGAHCVTSVAQAITGLTESVLNYIYAQRKTPATGRASASYTLGQVSFVANTTGVAPSNSILIATGTPNTGATNFASSSNTPAGRVTLQRPLLGDFVAISDTGNINTEFAVAHTLGRIPTGYLVVKKDKACDVYTATGGTSWTTSAIYLKSSVANCNVLIWVF